MTQKLADFIAVIQGLRKVLIMFVLMVIAVVFRILGYIDGASMVDLLKNTVVAFMAANSVERIGETIKHYITATVAAGKPVPPDEVVAVTQEETPNGQN